MHDADGRAGGANCDVGGDTVAVEDVDGEDDDGVVLTIPAHAERHALLQSAELASVPVDAVDHAVLLSRALVVRHAALGTAEETLAALAGDHPVVDARRLVPADLAGDDLDLR